jgi:hypothetical protein
VLPVVYGAGAKNGPAAKRHAKVLKSPNRSQAFLDAIDDVLAARAKSRDR